MKLTKVRKLNLIKNILGIKMGKYFNVFDRRTLNAGERLILLCSENALVYIKEELILAFERI